MSQVSMFEDPGERPAEPESRRVVLVSCCKTKAPTATAAAELYTSRVFRRSLAYARTLEPDDNIRIMSAAHGLVELERELAPYDATLRTMTPEDRQAWADGYFECGGCGAETAQWRAQCPCGSREIRRQDVPQLGSVL